MMKSIKAALVLSVILPVILVAGLDAKERQENSDPMIGAKVYGPTRLPVGDVVGILREEGTGNPVMYVVDADGIFNGRGVIPLSAVNDEYPVPLKNGGTQYRIEVSVNKATFKNIASWKRNETPRGYLSRMSGILSVIYRLDENLIDRTAGELVYDDGRAEQDSQPSIVSN